VKYLTAMLLLLIAVLLLAPPVGAEKVPLGDVQMAPALSWSRCVGTVQGAWLWMTPEGDTPAVLGKGEFLPRGTLGYSFKTLTVGTGLGYAVSSGLPEYAVGLRIAPFRRSYRDDAISAVGADYVIYGHGHGVGPALPRGEVVANLTVAKPLSAHGGPFDAAASMGYGLTSRVFTGRVALSYVVFDGGAR
jgi:hypothetical protein